MLSLQSGVTLAPYTTFQIGGNAAYFDTLRDVEALPEIINYAAAKNLPVFVLGGGSNVLVADAGYNGVVIKNELHGRDIVAEEDEFVLVRVGAGEVFDKLVAWSVAAGYWGLENLSHIPGSVGATPIQNIGAYGVEISACIEAVEAFCIDTQRVVRFSNSDCAFSYRHSFFKTTAGQRYIVTAVTYRLSKIPTPVISYRDVSAVFGAVSAPTQAAIREAIINIRSQKFPDWSCVGTAGSFFKNPQLSKAALAALERQYPAIPSFAGSTTDLVKVPLGWILEHVCGLRGAASGPVGSYQGQALVVVAEASATAYDVCEFTSMVAKKVKEKTNIDIEWEVTPVGFHS